jgi:hypothetical protein
MVEQAETQPCQDKITHMAQQEVHQVLPRKLEVVHLQLSQRLAVVKERLVVAQQEGQVDQAVAHLALAELRLRAKEILVERVIQTALHTGVQAVAVVLGQ